MGRDICAAKLPNTPSPPATPRGQGLGARGAVQ